MTNIVETDNQLCSRMMQGDRRAFEQLFRKFYPELCAYACQWVSIEDAENVVQDIMLWMWQNRSELKVENTLRSYLFVSTRNRCLTLINRGHLRQRIVQEMHQSLSEQFEAPDFYVIGDLVARLEQALAQLPESYREAFVQHRFRNKNHKEIAAEMGVSTKTVEYRIAQAVKYLRVELKDFLPLLGFLLTN